MKPHSTTTITILAIVAAIATATDLSARPTDFREVSLWIRARETDSSVVREVTQRKLTRALTSQEEATLKAQGASDSLIQSLRNPNLIASPAEVAASEAKPHPAKTEPQEATAESGGHGLRIFEVSAGHPINLSQWGGPDYEFAFNIYRFAGEDIVEPALVDTVRSTTDVATYIGPLSPGFRGLHPHFRNNRLAPYLHGDLKDDSYMIGDYTAAVSYSSFRGMSIDKSNPVFFDGVPYTFYPIYGVGGVSLYYIGSSSDSVKLAINTSGH